jgi:hypothetical protein
VFVTLRVKGESVASDWAEGDTAFDAAVGAASVSAEEADAGGKLDRVDSADLCLSHSFRDIKLTDSTFLTNDHRGVLGIELEGKGSVDRYSPTTMLANNWDFRAVFARFTRAHSINREEQSVTKARVFACDQVQVNLASAKAAQMERGNSVIPLRAVTQEGVRNFGDLMGEWLVNQLRDDGRMTYTYLPSQVEEAKSNNTIRQWMATVALSRFANSRNSDQTIYDLALRNIRYNLGAFYRTENGFGLIQEGDGSVKLGAVALAALALVEHPQREEFFAQEAALLRTVDHLWHEDGSFKTFYRPASLTGNENFYPGEALVLWSRLYEDNKDPELLDRIMKSFRYYRTWHLDNRNPAFVPWHTQAYFGVWRQTRNADLRAFIFEMNDWLLDIQQWSGVPYPDLRGRFYAPDRQHFGPPHASSTGVYLEGLIDAYALAIEVGDKRRADRYRLAMRRGVRSVMQLQFVDDVDMYYIRDKERVLGGLRTNPYDNVIRVDNNQHNLMGVLKILDSFAVDDFTR